MNRPQKEVAMKPNKNSNSNLKAIAENLNGAFLQDIRTIITTAQANAVRSVEFHRVEMYWKLGERIFVEEQQEKARAEYGAYLIQNLSIEMEKEFGSGFSKRQLERARQFYRLFPIASTLRTQLNWYQYRLLISIADSSKREFYELESTKNSWNGKELERQINAQLYERLLLSSDKESVMAVAREQRHPETAREIVKDPMYLEFLGLETREAFYEHELESSLISHLQEFLLELGNGYTFVARQKRLLIEDDEFFADLVFYNRLLRCFVVIELKTQKMTHRDLGQLQMYVNYYDRYEKRPEENPSIGILLCPARNKGVVEMTLPQDTAIYASEYQLSLPDAKLLERKIEEWVLEFEQNDETSHEVNS
jgi:predicted nuclease of restriction endonuclease-like (RecB) superfamily